MKKVIFVLFMLISSLCLFSCANTKESTSSTQESTINNQIKPDSIDYEDGKIFVSGVKDGTDSVKIYVGDRLVNNYDKSCVRNGVLEASYSIAYSSKDKGPVTIKAIAIKGDTTSEITNTVDFLEKVDTESVKFGQYYISFDEVENAQKYIIEFTEKDSINMVVNTSKMESETSFIEFEQSLNNKFDRYNNLYISIQPYATNYVSYPISQKYTRTPNVSNLSYSNSKITFTSGYDRHHIVITENGNTIDEIIDKDYYDYAPQGHNFSVSVSAYELEKELPAVNLNMKAIKNLDGFSFGEDKIVFENDDETATYTYKLYKDENVFKSAVKAQSITFKDYYYQILGENLRLEITRNIDTTKEYLVGETEFKLYCLNDFYISDSMLDSDVVGNKKTYGIKNSCEDSSVNVSVYKGDNLLDSKKYDYSSSTQNYEFNYEKDSTYKVVFERILSVEDGYIINLDRIHDKYEITHDIPTNVEAVSLEDASNDQIKITSEELDSKTDDCALYLDSTKLKDTYTYNNSFTISNSNFSDAKTYDLYLVSKYYTETEPVSIKVSSTTSSYTSLVYVENPYPIGYYSASLYNGDTLLKTNLYTNPNYRVFEFSNSAYVSDLTIVFTFRNTYSEKFNIKKLATPTIDINDGKLIFEGGNKYSLYDFDNLIESNLEVSEYELTNDHNRHYYSIKSIGNKALFEIDSDNTDCLNVIPLDNPIIDAYRASLFVPNLDSCVCHFILEVDGIESFTFNEDFNFGNLYSYGNQFTFTIQAIPNEKNYLKSEIVTYTLEKLVVNSIISNVKVDNETNSIKFESSLSNKTYDIALVDKKKGEYLFVSDTKELSCPIDVEEGEYTFILGIRSEVDNDIKKIYMSDDSSVEYNFVKDGIKKVEALAGSKYSITRLYPDYTSIGYKLSVDGIDNSTSTSDEIIVDLSSQNDGTVTVKISDNSSNQASNNANRFKFDDYEFQQKIATIDTPSLSYNYSYDPASYSITKLASSTAGKNSVPVSNNATITLTTSVTKFTKYSYYRYYGQTEFVSNYSNSTPDDSVTNTASTTYTITSGQTGCYTVRALIIANDFSGATYYKTSDFGKVEIPFIPHINKISIRCGLTNNTIYMSYNSLGSPVPFSVTSKIHLVITKNGSSMTIDQNTQTGNITDGGTSSGISTTSIGGVAPGDTISITMYIYNKYGKNATVTVNNLVLSSDTEYYGIPS